MKLNGNSKSVTIWVMVLVVSILLSSLITSWSGISGQAVEKAEEANELAIQNRQDIAVLKEQLGNIDRKLTEIKELLSQNKRGW